VDRWRGADDLLRFDKILCGSILESASQFALFCHFRNSDNGLVGDNGNTVGAAPMGSSFGRSLSLRISLWPPRSLVRIVLGTIRLPCQWPVDCRLSARWLLLRVALWASSFVRIVDRDDPLVVVAL
jgi:hypothetical protein